MNATYQDVLTAIELEECYDHRHPASRTECREARTWILDYYNKDLGWLITSETAADWAVPHMDSIRVHYPRREPQGKDKSLVGIPVPLFSLVFHDATLLVSRSVPAIIAAVSGMNTYNADDTLLRALHKEIAEMPLTKHELLADNGLQQRSVFGDAVTVEGDIEAGTYVVKGMAGKKEIKGQLVEGRMRQ
jgi:hypothetical protein